MKKVFLVRKDVNKPFGKDNWLVMNVAQFKKFRTTDEAKGRIFLRMFDFDSEGDVIIREYAPEEARIRNTELQRSKRQMKYIGEHDIKELRYSLVPVDGEMVSSDELIIDESQDVEEIVGKKLMVERLKKALTFLTEDEQRIIKAFFFNDEEKSARQIARDLGLPWSTAKSQKAAILSKLRKYL